MKFKLSRKDMHFNARKQTVQMPYSTLENLIQYVEDLEDKVLARGINLLAVNAAAKKAGVLRKIKKHIS